MIKLQKLKRNFYKGKRWKARKSVSLETYAELENYLSLNSKFKINRQDYYNDIKQSTLISKRSFESRWNFKKV